jgi:hypothetical protein
MSNVRALLVSALVPAGAAVTALAVAFSSPEADQRSPIPSFNDLFIPYSTETITISDGGSFEPFPVGPNLTAATFPLPDDPPRGYAPVSEYYEFLPQALDETNGGVLTLNLPLFRTVEQSENPGFFSYIDGEWVRISDAALTQGGIAVETTFESTPLNVVVMVED